MKKGYYINIILDIDLGPLTLLGKISFCKITK